MKICIPLSEALATRLRTGVNPVAFCAATVQKGALPIHIYIEREEFLYIYTEREVDRCTTVRGPGHTAAHGAGYAFSATAVQKGALCLSLSLAFSSACSPPPPPQVNPNPNPNPPHPAFSVYRRYS